MFKDRAVKDAMQIGFHLSASVVLQITRTQFNVAVTFDRQRISSCNCTCSSTAHWCSHIVAVCLFRIHQPHSVMLRAPVSESLTRLRRDQLQKFAQYLISELPRQVLPTAQRILDELLSMEPNSINLTYGAPDPTAGASAYEYTAWYLDDKTLHNNINKILVKFCVPAPIVFSDVNYLSTSAPPAAAEWSSLLRPLRGREPEGMWNLLSIVREMFKRNDRNGIPLLEIITEEVMACEQIVVWWYSTKAALVAWGGGSGGKHNGGAGSSASQHACSSLCDEVVLMWRLAALNPALAPQERDTLHEQFSQWHMKVLDKVAKNRTTHHGSSSGTSGHARAHTSSRHHSPYINGISESEVFPGFHPAMEACFLEWEDYPIPGVTYTKDLNPLYHSPFTIFRHSESKNDQVHQVNSSKAVLNHEMSLAYRLANGERTHGQRVIIHRSSRLNNDRSIEPQQACGSGEGPSDRPDGNRSSVSSEGFCENEEEILQQSSAETDSQASSSTPGSSDDAQRRVSNDDSVSDDDYNLYFYDAAAARRLTGEGPSNSGPAPSIGHGGSWECGSWEVLFARAEGLHAHGHAREACALGVRLARELLARPPVLALPDPSELRRGKRRQLHGFPPRVSAATHRLSCVASATLAKCAFLCSVLAEFSEHHELAFRVGLFALEMSRPPASTKALEVKLSNQESELVTLLKKLPTGPEQLQLAREKAEQLRDGSLRNRGPALLPIALASFIFDVIVLSANDKAHRYPTDEALGFEAAVAALGLKANISEAEHPLLCEGTRRQRGDLALTLLCYYRDDPVKLARIMNKLLDRDIHQLTKSPMISIYYMTNPRLSSYRMEVAGPSNAMAQASCSLTNEMERMVLADGGASPPAHSHATSSSSSTHQPVARAKDSRFKGKRMYPSVPNQPSEASAHFMFELAKSVLCKAGGSSSTSLFTQTSAAREHHGPHRGLHMAAFQLGLYALGLHNCVSANWLSRTYSSHVSWITGQAMDIGAPAILFLIDAWEAHLTPPEAASIADKASSGRDPHTVRAAAELALSVLPHAHALNYTEIQRAVLQCKEQSDAMLERACLTVEAAAKGGGVYPEVLYTVARYWHELYLRQTHGAGLEEELPPFDEITPPTVAPQHKYCAVPPVALPVQYAVPYGFTYHPYVSPLYRLQYPTPPPQFALPQYFMPQHRVAHHAPPPFEQHPSQMVQGGGCGPPPQPPPPPAPVPPPMQQAQLRRLLAAYRVGMLALETQARRVHDDRPQNKFGRTPPYGEHVKWLMRISKRLGAQYLHQFCVSAVNSVVSPFVLYELALESAHWLARGGPHHLVMQHLRGTLAPLVQKCQQMYIQCIHQKLYHLTAVDYEDFVSIVLSARTAFQLTPEGNTQFKEWLASLRRSKSCKKDLWAQLNAALLTNGK